MRGRVLGWVAALALWGVGCAGTQAARAPEEVRPAGRQLPPELPTEAVPGEGTAAYGMADLPAPGPHPREEEAPPTAAPVRPPTSVPGGQLVLPPVRLHLQVHEDMEPDLLRSLARPGTVAWVQTSSNMLRESAVDALRPFEAAWVQVRPPLLDAHVRQLRRAPRAGVWLTEEALGGAGLYRVGPRPLAVEVRGPLTEARAERVRRARPREVRWVPAAEGPSLEEWSRFAQLPGRRVLAWAGQGEALSVAWACALPAATRAGLLLEVEAPTAEALEQLPVPGCGVALRVRLVRPPSDAGLARLFSLEPGSELEVVVADALPSVRAVKALQERLLDGPVAASAP